LLSLATWENNLEEGKFTYIENGYRIEKVEIAYGCLKMPVNAVDYEKI